MKKKVKKAEKDLNTLQNKQPAPNQMMMMVRRTKRRRKMSRRKTRRMRMWKWRFI